LSEPAHLTVDPLYREGIARSCKVHLGYREFLTPGFVIRIDSREKLSLYLKLKKKYKLEHVTGYVVRLADAQRVLGQRISDTQVDLQGRFVEGDFLKSSLSDLILIDPALENLYYATHAGDFASTRNLPHALTDYSLSYLKQKSVQKNKEEIVETPETGIRKWLDAKHGHFWQELELDERIRTRFIRDLLVRQHELGAPILIPPVPLITNDRLFELTKTINRKSSEVSRVVGECADAFTFRLDVLRNSSLLEELRDYIDAQNARITLFKFKYMNLNEEDRVIERKNFRDFLQTLDLKSRLDRNRTFMLLEAGNLAYACAGRGFDFLSTSFSLDREDRVRKQQRSPWGKWFDPYYQVTLDRDSFMDAYRNNGSHIPCDCPECTTSTSKPESLGIDEWNQFVKGHYLSRRNKDYTEIAKAIESGTATAGIVDRLRDSALKNLLELVR